MTDAQLVERARGGEAAAFGELVTRHGAAVYRTALAALRSPADAEDVAQEAFVLAYRRLRAFRGESSVRTWILAIAWRLALTRRRSLLRRLRRLVSLVPPADGLAQSIAPSPEELVVDADQLRHVRRVIATLPPALRDALLLSAVEELGSEDIAALLGVPPGTVRWRISEARRRLREKLARMDRFEAGLEGS
ncbi:MAG: sigma-70 family RNA polymerase sigma factor [Gemmatimonadetes bacterium]|nr:sigma-70 family RNA polymerase sigma factor [Gemmatimonadota bacterium]